MTGLELIKAPGATSGEIADIISQQCPPNSPTLCDGVACKECWLSWLVTGEAKSKEPPMEGAAPERMATEQALIYKPSENVISRAMNRVADGDLTYTAATLTGIAYRQSRRSDKHKRGILLPRRKKSHDKRQ